MDESPAVLSGAGVAAVGGVSCSAGGPQVTPEQATRLMELMEAWLPVNPEPAGEATQRIAELIGLMQASIYLSGFVGLGCLFLLTIIAVRGLLR